MARSWRTVVAAALGLLASAVASASGLSASTLAALQRGEAVLLMRHATAPGVGDPPHFRLGDCTTQRNLSAAGEAQAQQAGERLRAAGISALTVWTSPWCRCQATAERLGYGAPQVMPAFGSFFQGYTEESVQTQAAEHLLATAPAGALLVVTHQVNITALTQGKVYPKSGEIIAVLRRQPATVLQRLAAAP